MQIKIQVKFLAREHTHFKTKICEHLYNSRTRKVYTINSVYVATQLVTLVNINTSISHHYTLMSITTCDGGSTFNDKG